MKNLELLTLEHESLTKRGIHGHPILTQDYSSCKYNINYEIRDSTLYKCEETCSVPLDLTIQKLVDHKYLPIEDKLCLVSSRELYFIDDACNKTAHCFEHEIEAFAWNSSLDAAAVVFSNGDVCTYQFGFEAEPYQQGKSCLDAAVPDSTAVGWGSVETQFKGSERKKASTVEKILEVIPVEDKKPLISWRGNGEEFVINYWNNGERHFKVFDSLCNPKAKSEATAGLQPPITFKNQGITIAAVKCVNNKHSVVFFERNGLLRSTFDLSDIQGKIVDIKWSPCDKILALLETIEGQQRIFLYSCLNATWYLKQTLVFTDLEDFEFVPSFNGGVSLRVLTSKEILNYTFHFRFHVSCDHSRIYCVNGRNVLITSVSDELVPPPMYSSKLELDNAINSVAVHPYLPFIAILDSIGDIRIFQSTDLVEIKGFNVGKTPYLSNLHWFGSSLKLIDKENEKVLTFPIGEQFELLQNNLLPSSWIYKDGCPQSVFYDGNVEHAIDKVSLHTVAKNIDNCLYVLLLTPNQEFYINTTLISNSVNSFTVYEDYLLFVANSALYCANLIQIHELVEKGISSFYCRKFYELADVVCVVPNTANVTLAVARGNFEVISNRLMSIDIVEKLLSKNQWQEAIYYLRNERLDFNLLIDLNPRRFFECLPQIVEATKQQKILSVLCMEIQDVDVLATKYGKCRSGMMDGWTYKGGKRQMFFEELLRSLDVDACESDHLQTLLMICLNNFSVAHALQYLLDSYRLIKGGENSLKDVAVSGIQILRLFIDDETLFKESLLLYDLEFVKYISTYLNKDPKETKLILENFQAVEDEMTKRYLINVHLKRPAVATCYLLRQKGANLDNFLNFIEQERVTDVAFKECHKISSPFLKETGRLHAKILSQKGNHEEAAVVLTSLEFFDQAIEQYILALQWHQVVGLLDKTSHGEEKKLEILKEMARKLADSGNFTDASYILEWYCRDYVKAIDVLLQGKCFLDARRVAQGHQLHHLVETQIVPEIKLFLENLSGEIEERSVDFDRLKNRLIVVRDNMKSKFEEFGDIFGQFDSKQSDLYSEDGSTISRTSSGRRSKSKRSDSTTSGNTTTTVRNARKEMKRRTDLKEGGPYEDIAIIRQLSMWISGAFCCSYDMRLCSSILLEENQATLAILKRYQSQLVQLQDKMILSFPEIWPEDFCLNSENEALIANLPYLDESYRKPPEIERLRNKWIMQILT